MKCIIYLLGIHLYLWLKLWKNEIFHTTLGRLDRLTSILNVPSLLFQNNWATDVIKWVELNMNLYLSDGYALVKLFCPISPRHPRGHYLFFVASVSLTSHVTTFALYKHSNYSFFKCPALFYHLHFYSDPGAAPGEDGGRTIWPAH